METDTTAIICIFIAMIIACAVFLIITDNAILKWINEIMNGITEWCHGLYSKKDWSNWQAVLSLSRWLTGWQVIGLELKSGPPAQSKSPEISANPKMIPNTATISLRISEDLEPIRKVSNACWKVTMGLNIRASVLVLHFANGKLQ